MPFRQLHARCLVACHQILRSFGIELETLLRSTRIRFLSTTWLQSEASRLYTGCLWCILQGLSRRPWHQTLAIPSRGATAETGTTQGVQVAVEVAVVATMGPLVVAVAEGGAKEGVTQLVTPMLNPTAGAQQITADTLTGETMEAMDTLWRQLTHTQSNGETQQQQQEVVMGMGMGIPLTEPTRLKLPLLCRHPLQVHVEKPHLCPLLSPLCLVKNPHLYPHQMT
jgi:hypothetical protein